MLNHRDILTIKNPETILLLKLGLKMNVIDLLPLLKFVFNGTERDIEGIIFLLMIIVINIIFIIIIKNER